MGELAVKLEPDVCTRRNCPHICAYVDYSCAGMSRLLRGRIGGPRQRHGQLHISTWQSYAESTVRHPDGRTEHVLGVGLLESGLVLSCAAVGVLVWLLLLLDDALLLLLPVPLPSLLRLMLMWMRVVVLGLVLGLVLVFCDLPPKVRCPLSLALGTRQ